MQKLIILLSFLFYAGALSTAHAKNSTPPFENIYFNAGTHTEFFNAVQVDDSGTMRRFDFQPTIGVGTTLELDWGWVFQPEFNWVLPYSSYNTEVIKNLFMLRGDFSYDPLDWLRLRIGTSLMILNQHGKGGTARINNGNGTSTFYHPDENHSSVNNTFDLGAEFLYDDWGWRLQTYTYSLFKEEQRQISYSIFVTYYWNL